MTIRIIQGDCVEQLQALPANSVQCCVTSPPYWGLRDYGVEGQFGLERTPQEYVEKMVQVFREVKRVLRDDGTLWLNIGDGYNSGRNGGHPGGKKQWKPDETKYQGRSGANAPGLKPKDLCGIPWRVAFALQADGWWLRQDCIWHKPNPMPESVTDRCTKAHEYIFLLTKAERYFFDNEAIREPIKESCDGTIRARARTANGALGGDNQHSIEERLYDRVCGANKRSVWTITTKGFSEAHFATFPPELPEICIKAGTSERGVCPACGEPWRRIVEKETIRRVRPNAHVKYAGDNPNGQPDQTRSGVQCNTIGWQPACACGGEPVPATVLDPFAGAGTTGLVADRLGRNAILIELNPKYAEMMRNRIHRDAPLLTEIVE